jgi:exodeoxyribonuclease VII large subunit
MLPSVAEGKEERVFQVAQIEREVRFLLEDVYRDVWVEGEVSGTKASQQGHVYFRLNDTREKAALDAVIFASDARRAKVRIADGLRVRCKGKLTLYEPQGRFQLVATVVRPAGQGDLLARVEELKKKLAAEGLFDAAHKRPLPMLPRTVGVVTSREGAAIRDVIQVAHRRHGVRILLAHASVQGDTAPGEIVWGIRMLERRADVDVIVVGRGGGSIEDLMAFNDERVVRAIAACNKPIVSAVGHEIDFTLADLAADVRAPTPSAAAEIVVPERAVLQARIDAWTARLRRGAQDAVRERRRILAELRAAIEDPASAIASHRQTLDQLVAGAERAVRQRLRRERDAATARAVRLARTDPRARLAADRARLGAARQAMRTAQAARVARARARAERLGGSLGALSPVAVLGRGYAIALHVPSGRALRDPHAAAAGDPLEIVIEQGRLRARVE